MVRGVFVPIGKATRTDRFRPCPELRALTEHPHEDVGSFDRFRDEHLFTTVHRTQPVERLKAAPNQLCQLGFKRIVLGSCLPPNLPKGHSRRRRGQPCCSCVTVAFDVPSAAHGCGCHLNFERKDRFCAPSRVESSSWSVWRRRSPSFRGRMQWMGDANSGHQRLARANWATATRAMRARRPPAMLVRRWRRVACALASEWEPTAWPHFSKNCDETAWFSCFF